MTGIDWHPFISSKMSSKKLELLGLVYICSVITHVRIQHESMWRHESTSLQCHGCITKNSWATGFYFMCLLTGSSFAQSDKAGVLEMVCCLSKCQCVIWTFSFMTERPSYAPPPPPAPTTVSIHKQILRILSGAANNIGVLQMSWFYIRVRIIKTFFKETRLFVEFTNPVSDHVLINHCFLKALAWLQLTLFCTCSASFMGFFCLGFPPSPSFRSFLIHVSVSFVSISKCPTLPGLWGTTHTAIWPTTTTDWEGAKAATVG